MSQCRMIRRLGYAGFAFFAIKGCLWLALAGAASMGLLTLPGH